MGTDIHGVVEVKVNGKWIGIKDLKGNSRNYQRFAMLAGVRGDGPKPLGIPSDISETTKYHIDLRGDDGHSHSYLPLSEAEKIFAKTAPEKTMNVVCPLFAFFGIDDDDHGDSIDDFRLVFWFDN